MDESTYTVFVRDWWYIDERGNRQPLHNGEREILAEGLSRAEAREMCKEYNEDNDPGELSRKAEFEEE